MFTVMCVCLFVCIITAPVKDRFKGNFQEMMAMTQGRGSLIFVMIQITIWIQGFFKHFYHCTLKFIRGVWHQWGDALCECS